MADASWLARFFSEFTPTTWSVIVLIAGMAVVGIKVWPLIKGRINEARKIELDADAALRGDLFKRIKELEEAQDRDRLEFYDAKGAERRRCDAELDAIRARLTTAENENKGLMRAIRQHSQSAGFLLDQKGQLGAKPRRRKPEEPKK